MKNSENVQFTISYFRKNFDYKQLCEDWLPYSQGGNLLNSVVICVGMERYKELTDEIDENTQKLIRRFDRKQNNRFSQNLASKELDGTLLPFLCNNFSLVCKLRFHWYRCFLIYSKYNKTYYYLHMNLYYDNKKNKFIELVDFFDVPKIFKTKKKPSYRSFFEIILNRDKNLYSKKEFDALKSKNLYLMEDGVSAFELYSYKLGIMKD